MNKFQQDFIIEESTSDKISHHGYHRFYPWFLTHLRGQNVNFLEIGIDKTESLKLWKGYFGNVNLHGIDIDEKEFNDTEVTLHKIDQSNSLELDKFVADVGIKFKSQQRTNSKIRTVQTFRMVMSSLFLQGLVHTPPVCS